jgi:hypothetical protein
MQTWTPAVSLGTTKHDNMHRRPAQPHLIPSEPCVLSADRSAAAGSGSRCSAPVGVLEGSSLVTDDTSRGIIAVDTLCSGNVWHAWRSLAHCITPRDD